MLWPVRRTPRVAVICPGCGRNIKKSPRWLERNRHLCCPACHLEFDLEQAENGVAQSDGDAQRPRGDS